MYTYVYVYNIYTFYFISLESTYHTLIKKIVQAKEHLCITHRHRRECGHGQREGGSGRGGGGQRGENGKICNSVNNKNKV